jgi:hypothetical protein
LDLLVVRKHVYNCNRVFKAADHILVGIAGHKIVTQLQVTVTSYKLLTRSQCHPVWEHNM